MQRPSVSGGGHHTRRYMSEQSAAVLMKTFPTEDPRVLQSFLSLKSNDVDQATSHYQVGV